MGPDSVTTSASPPWDPLSVSGGQSGLRSATTRRSPGTHSIILYLSGTLPCPLLAQPYIRFRELNACLSGGFGSFFLDGDRGERLGSERKSESPPYVVSSKNGLSESWSGKRQIESKGKGAEKGEIVRKGRGASPYYTIKEL
ncbi:FAD-dependent pyridine nucleotide-disulfideoxidoreductase [Striga asiatica]|uniref:FAD-dependent pyridine nucleotide-disulfideoxidoreductase n=1 Tax=Striga asiatica TaxID=4170 RepID=A0A5A7Q1R8_STRAF|nr:FAD-dependent pyridine nucleotide-disulfideoxidoreductase [Striga asiatica]